MPLSGQELRPGMQAGEVKQLHAVLRQLGFGKLIAADEVATSTYGKSTARAVTEFQQQNKLQPTGIVDGPTASALNQAIGQGEGQSTPEFVVRGHVRSLKGMPLSGLTIRAFDADLPSRNADELLGEMQTDKDGAYRIPYRAEQFTLTEQQTADLRVKAFDSKGTLLAESTGIFFNAPAVAEIDVIAPSPDDAVSEFARLLATLTPLIDTIPITQLTADDVAFLSGETMLNSQLIGLLTVAHRHAAATDIQAEVFYGLLREGLPNDLPQLVASGRDALRAALKRATGNTIISPSLTDQLEEILTQLEKLRVHMALAPSDSDKRSPIAAMLNIAGLSPDHQATFLSAWFAHQDSGGEPDRFWEGLKQDTRFTREAVDNVQLSFQVGAMTLGYLPLVTALQQRRQSKQWLALRDLARLDRSDWVNLINDVGRTSTDPLPSTIQGKSPEETTQTFADFIAEAVERQFPTAVIANRLGKDTEFHLANKDEVVAFLTSQPDFDLSKTHIKSFFAKADSALLSGIKNTKAVIQQLETMQRIAHIAPQYDQMRALLTKGIDSSLKVSRYSPEVFVNEHADLLGGYDQAQKIYDTAQQKTATTLNLATDLHPWQQVLPIPVLPDASIASDSVPDLKTLFGSLDYCACKDCQSVLSPAAYLVDTLQFLRYRPVGDGASALEILLRRRPDLAEIELSCDNTNTTVPYIDLVNELLENAVVATVTEDEWHHRPLPPAKHELFQTRRTAEELAAYPEHVNARAYEALRSAQYPWPLPFDLPFEEARSYLDQLGTSRAALIDTLQPSMEPADRAAIARAQDLLGIPPAAWPVITGTQALTPADVWGAPGIDDEKVTTFLRRSGLSYAELTELLAMRFLNPDPTHRLVDILPIESCQLDEMRLAGLTDVLRDKIHRVVRLWRRLGWPISQIDEAIHALGSTVPGANALDQNCLLRLADVTRAQALLNLSLPEALSLWGPLSTNGPESSYAKVFWNTTLRSQFNDPAFDPAIMPLSGTGGEPLEPHIDVVCAALRLSRKDVDRLLVAWRRLAPSGTVGLGLDTLSFFYRHSLLARKLGLSIEDLLALASLTGLEPFNQDVMRMLHAADTVQRSNFTMIDLRLIFLTPLDTDTDLAPKHDAIALILNGLQRNLQQVERDATVQGDRTGEQTRRQLAQLQWNPAIIGQLIRMLTDQEIYSVQLRAVLPAGFSFPQNLRTRLSIHPSTVAGHVTIQCRGVLTTEQLNLLRSDAALTGLGIELQNLYNAAIMELYNTPRIWARRTLAAFAYTVPLAALPTDLHLPPELSNRLTYEPDTQTLHFAGAMTTSDRAQLTTASFDPVYREAIDALFRAPDAISQPPELAFLNSAQVEALLDVALLEGEAAGERFARLQRFTESPTPVGLGPYLSRQLKIRAVIDAFAEPLGVTSTLLQPLLTRYLQRLDDSAQFVITAFLDDSVTSGTPPAPELVKIYRFLYNVTVLLKRFDVTVSDLPWLFRPVGDSAADLNPNRLAHVADNPSNVPTAFRAWTRMGSLFQCRTRLGSDYFGRIIAIARGTAPDLGSIENLMAEALSWSLPDIQTFVTHRWLETGTFINEQGLAASFGDEHIVAQVIAGIDLALKLGVKASDTLLWATPRLTPDIAASIRDAVRARYTTEQWPTIAKPLRDRLREKQRDALVAYLIATVRDSDTGELAWRDARDLYAYFLVDADMSACQATSRIKLAHSSIQLFVQRCLMHLERRVTIDQRRDSGWHQWEWMKNYRVWEANRQIFLYPENWIEPDLRDDKTEFFKDLGSDLLQNDLTAETAETAFLNYFDKLDTVSRLEICAMYRQPSSAIQDPTILHLFGRTRGTPHVYYYRRQIRTTFSSSWTPWEQVNLDIVGDHLIPVVWNDRLYLFWPIFTEHTESQRFRMPPTGSAPPEPDKYSKVQLAWSEHRHGEWTPKTISKEFVKIPSPSETYFQANPVGRGDLEIRVNVRAITPQLRRLRAKFEDEQDQHTDPIEFGLTLLNRGIEPELSFTSFRLSGFDGTVHLIPYGDINFIEMPRGTTLSGMTFVESHWAAEDTIQNVIPANPALFVIPINTPEGVGAASPTIFVDAPRENTDAPMQPIHFSGRAGRAARRPANPPHPVPPGTGGVQQAAPARSPLLINPDWMYTVANAADVRGAGTDLGDSLLLRVPLRHSQLVLSRLPQHPSNESPNRFQVLVPYNQLNDTLEFCYQDDARTFYACIAYTQEEQQAIQEIMQLLSEHPDGFGVLLLLPLGGLGKYQFHSHYHPYARLLRQRVIRLGVQGLLQRDVQIAPQNLTNPPQFLDFVGGYGPNPGFVHLDSSAPGGVPMVPIEEIDFSPEGAYSQYNWELFFHAPLLIADKLSKNQRFEEAQRWFHTIFDPTDLSTESTPQRFWQTRPFFETTQAPYQQQRIDQLLRHLAEGTDDGTLRNQVAAWRKDPFNPHLVARTRTTAFQRTVVMKYLDNLIAWGDQLFRQESLESLNEATQLYILAAEILGRRPERITRRVETASQTYDQLAPRLDIFSNALIQFENHTPPPRGSRPLGDMLVDGISSVACDGIPQPGTPAKFSGPVLLPMPDLYFCILPNEMLLKYWDRVADRLFKLRHCMNIDGIVRELPLFDAPIDPGLLVRARALGVDLRTVLSDMGAPLSQYRFLIILQKASELCAEVRGFGAALLSALEKKDAEALSRLRSGHELNILNQMQRSREQQVEEAQRGLDALLKSQEAITLRRDHYSTLLKEFMNPGEQANLKLMTEGLKLQFQAAGLELTANMLHMIPNAKAGAPTSIGITFGGDNLGKALEAFAKYLTAQASMIGTTAAMGAILAGYARRAQEWKLQISLTDKELQQIEKQIAAAQIRIDLAQREKAIHEAHIRQAKEVDGFMRSKFTSLELYDWMSRQLADVYFQCYQLAYDMAKRAERAFRFERGLDSSNFIQYGYWDNLHKGLLAGERLQFALRKLELAYIEQNRREHELTKHISLALVDPFALHRLRTEGKCVVSLPESLFDHDHPGHYMRRIKAVALTLPAVVGPYTSVNCRLTLQSSFVRVKPDLLASGSHQYVPDDMTNDDRFRADLGSVQSIATSRGNSDTGLFEVNFRDERYLPFEGAGVISSWMLELDPLCNDFDLSTVSDVVMELRYTARDGGERLRTQCIDEVLKAAPRVPRARLFSARTDFADAWNAFLHPLDNGSGQTLVLDLTPNRFPFRAQQKTIQFKELHVVLVLSEKGKEHFPPGGIRIVIQAPDGTVVTPTPPTAPPSENPGGLVINNGEDTSLSNVPGGFQPLTSLTGTGTWRFMVSQEVIHSLPDLMKVSDSSGGRQDRIASDVLEDLLVFVVYAPQEMEHRR